jgi:23S rRNA pseudouridine1911/1915/1917 synthase
VADPIELQVPAALDGARLDKALAELLELSRARAATVIEDGVEIDGDAARASDRVRLGQTITCQRPRPLAELAPESIGLDILHEDAHVIVVNKLPGLVVHPGSGRTAGTLASGLIHRYPELVGVGASDRWGLLHRLDKDTSGAILVARTQIAFDDLTSQLRDRQVGRTYVALVEGRMGAPTGTVEAPIGRDPARPTRRAITHGGKPARTHYEETRYFERADASLLEVRLDTGRTHQIRVHMAAIGHPVAGDITYGATRRDLGARRTFLHASRLEFNHPGDGRRQVVDAPLAEDLVGLLERLEATDR